MDINYIREFTVLADVGNFLQAADMLFTTQSSLSRHIKALEEELGEPLFDRTTRKIVLNHFGALFLPYAREISRLQYEYTTALANESQRMRETLTIGSTPVMSQYHITDILAQFQNENQHITLNVIEADSADLLHMITSEECDFIFIREADNYPKDLIKIPYATDILSAIVPETHPLAQASHVSLGDLKGESFLMLPPKTYMHKLCLSACEKSGFSPRIVFTGHRGETLADLASKGMGIALLTKKPAAYFAPSNVRIIDIVPNICTGINLVYKKSMRMTPAARHFLNCVETTRSMTLSSQSTEKAR